jgi:hypothetical protein
MLAGMLGFGLQLRPGCRIRLRQGWFCAARPIVLGAVAIVHNIRSARCCTAHLRSSPTVVYDIGWFYRQSLGDRLIRNVEVVCSPQSLALSFEHHNAPC